MSSFLSHLEWRHATKGFDPSKQVPETHLQQILHAIKMAPTSFGLQPFQVEVIKDLKLREKLLPHAWNQNQVVSCSALLVFVARSNINSRIDEYFTGASGGNADVRAKMKDYENMMRGPFKDRSEEDSKAWATKQAYIALGFGLAACAELKIDSCPMEGFVSAEFDKILGLPKGQSSAVLLAVGYRNPTVPPMPKFRFSDSDLFKSR